MLPTTLFNIIAIIGLGGQASARISGEEAKAACGPLGVLDLSHLPEGFDPEDARVCADHPLGSATRLHQARSEELNVFDKRTCWKGAPVGCTKGYCWKSCGKAGSGEWCWTAKNDGWGAWETCSRTPDCSAAMACSHKGDCDSCGCSC